MIDFSQYLYPNIYKTIKSKCESIAKALWAAIVKDEPKSLVEYIRFASSIARAIEIERYRHPCIELLLERLIHLPFDKKIGLWDFILRCWFFSYVSKEEIALEGKLKESWFTYMRQVKEELSKNRIDLRLNEEVIHLKDCFNMARALKNHEIPLDKRYKRFLVDMILNLKNENVIKEEDLNETLKFLLEDLMLDTVNPVGCINETLMPLTFNIENLRNALPGLDFEVRLFELVQNFTFSCYLYKKAGLWERHKRVLKSQLEENIRYLSHIARWVNMHKKETNEISLRLALILLINWASLIVYDVAHLLDPLDIEDALYRWNMLEFIKLISDAVDESQGLVLGPEEKPDYMTSAAVLLALSTLLKPEDKISIMVLYDQAYFSAFVQRFISTTWSWWNHPWIKEITKKLLNNLDSHEIAKNLYDVVVGMKDKATRERSFILQRGLDEIKSAGGNCVELSAVITAIMLNLDLKGRIIMIPTWALKEGTFQECNEGAHHVYVEVLCEGKYIPIDPYTNYEKRPYEGKLKISYDELPHLNIPDDLNLEERDAIAENFAENAGKLWTRLFNETLKL